MYWSMTNLNLTTAKHRDCRKHIHRPSGNAAGAIISATRSCTDRNWRRLSQLWRRRTKVDLVTRSLAIIIVAAPALLVGVLGMCLLVGRPLSERMTARFVGWMLGSGLVASLAMCAVMLWQGNSH